MDERIPISALNLFSYCPRRCYLIHAEAEFEDNAHTLRGTHEHERVDGERHEVSAGVRVEYGLPVWSQRLGLSGRCDAVELRPDGTIYPIEYKHGKRRPWLNDDLQLAAQALCLEEMLDRTIRRGAIYHQQSRHRREVLVDETLRREVEDAVSAVRALLARTERPPPVADARRCRECSLQEICRPDLAGGSRPHGVQCASLRARGRSAVTVLLNTLYVTTPEAYLRLEGDTVCVMVEKEKRLQVPMHHVGAIVCFGDVMLSPALLGRCMQDGRSVVWLERGGRFRARAEGPVNGNILLRQAQYRTADDAEKTIELARAFLAGKLRNSRTSLLRGARDNANEREKATLVQSSRLVAGHIRKLPHATDLDALRGAEGDAARVYFQSLQYLMRERVREEFAFEARTRRPPLDPMNALLSFLYALVLNDCRSALEGVGLDPQLGFLHALRPGRMALALDILEEFRSVIADRLALTLVNRAQIRSRHFDRRPGGAVLLNDEGRKLVITAYQERKQESLVHPVLGQQVLVGLLPHMQARMLARYLRRDAPAYVPYLHR